MAELTYRDAVAAAIAQEMERDENVFLIGEEVAPSSSVVHPAMAARTPAPGTGQLFRRLANINIWTQRP